MLEVTDLSVSFGGLHAVDDVSMRVPAGRVVGLIGPNGAGKTTFVDAITGFVRSAGSVTLGGRALHGLRPHQRVRAGLARTWQSVELFDDLSVRDNVAVAGPDDALDRVGIAELADRMPGELSHGERKLVGVARALASAPTVVCMDEPAAGLDSDESAALGARLRRVASGDVGVLLIDHDMGLVLSVCDDVYVLEFGQVIAHGSPAEVRDDPRVLAAYLGASR